ncbi:acid-sensing ion channel 2-like [Strongylocentrotus purpuratus]|uniref:Uncharacterized protein n=1 Tax=Strongylocentrotus purpuratus TaxID=7668 RepID=A0A7M7PCJ1_STRPU|nr:acid-sensing ion channel 2-like [Strongylocentrotus purpuratus]
MPIKKMTVEPMKTTSAKEQTISSMVDQGMMDMKRTPYPPSYNDRMSWFAVLYRFVPDGIGVAGIRYAFNPREIKLRRLTWLLLVFIAFCMTGGQVIDRILFFASHPKDVDISIDYKEEVPFPSVAICNINQFRRRAVTGTVFEDFLPDMHFNYPSVNLTKYRSELEAYEMTRVLREMGHDIELTLPLGMSWNGRELTHANFTRRVTDAGVCIVFNDIDNGFPQLMVKSSGMLPQP